MGKFQKILERASHLDALMGLLEWPGRIGWLATWLGTLVMAIGKAIAGGDSIDVALYALITFVAILALIWLSIQIYQSLSFGKEERDVSLFDAIAYKAFGVWPHEKDIEIRAEQLSEMFDAKDALLQAAADGPDKLKIWGKPANRFEGVLELIEPDYWKQYGMDSWEIVKVAYGEGKRESMKTQAPEFSRQAWRLYDNLMTSKVMVRRLK